MRLVVGIGSAEQQRWLEAVEFAGTGITVVPFLLASELKPSACGHQVACANGAPAGGLPDLAQLMGGLTVERSEACLVIGEEPCARLLALAADLLGQPVFYLVTSAEQLRNLGARSKARPDLFFLTNPGLLPPALADPRYGSTLLPTGHPRDSGARLLTAIAAWREGRLDPSLPALSVVVPAFCEAANLPLVCDRLLAALDGRVPSFEILLVDDGSPDDTYRVACEQMWRSSRIRAFTKGPPRGMGNTIQRGLDRARATVIAVTMGDGSDEVERIPEMFAAVQEQGFGLAIGSRYRYRANYQTVPRPYRFWSACFRVCARLLIGLELSDYTNAFRVLDRRIFSRYGPESGGFEISPETTFKAWFATRKVTEVDVRHLKRASGQSSFSFLRAGPGYGRILLKAFIYRLTGRWFTLEW